MQLTVRDVAELLNVSERTIYRWIKEESIPAYKIHDQYRFNRSELLEWATANRIGISHEIFQEPTDKNIVIPKITDALKKGGIHYRVSGEDKTSALRSVIDILHLPEEADKELLFKVILAREELGSTGIGEGIAIPHARNPIIADIQDAIISLCFLEKPVDFGSIDGKPVNCLFTLISPTVRCHLQLLSRLAYILSDTEVKHSVINQAPRETILAGFERAEKNIKSSS